MRSFKLPSTIIFLFFTALSSAVPVIPSSLVPRDKPLCSNAHVPAGTIYNRNLHSSFPTTYPLTPRAIIPPGRRFSIYLCAPHTPIYIILKITNEWPDPLSRLSHLLWLGSTTILEHIQLHGDGIYSTLEPLIREPGPLDEGREIFINTEEEIGGHEFGWQQLRWSVLQTALGILKAWVDGDGVRRDLLGNLTFQIFDGDAFLGSGVYRH